MGRMFARAFLCGAGGLLGWLITEGMLDYSNQGGNEIIMVVAALGLISLAGGFHQGYSKGGTRNILFGMIGGLILGLVGGLFGYQIGGGLADAIGGPGWSSGSIANALIPRIVVFSIIGACLGLGVGASRLSWRIALSGMFGGLIGGMVSGALFDFIGSTIGAPAAAFSPGQTVETGGPGRAVFFTLLGFTIGLFSALIDNITRRAWVRLVLGRNEGKEWPVDSARTTLGRDERAHIPLFGDQNVAPLHATIDKHQGAYVLQDAGSGIGTGHNGIHMTAPISLAHGDTIQVGSHQLQFLMKSGQAPTTHEGRAHAVPVGGSQQPVQNQPVPQAQPMAQVQPQVTQVQPQAAIPVLVAFEGPLLGNRYEVNQPLEIGREATGITLGFDQQASRRHALVSLNNGQVHVHDLNSTNGTLLNGQKIEQANMNKGDTLQIGASKFRLE